MEITVLKLGGSILCGPEDLERIADVVESEINAGVTSSYLRSNRKDAVGRVLSALVQTAQQLA